ncbi:MAG: hypothetical protein ACRDY3_04615 [Acidimicrobiales bacterium]
MGKLYGSLTVLALLFSASMSFATLSVYTLAWWPGAVAGGLFVVFAALGGVVVPGPLRSLSGARLKAAKALLQAFGAFCGAELFTMALITWTLGKRHIAPNDAYDTLGLLIFLGLLGVGIQGAVAMASRFFYVRNQQIVVPRLEAAAQRHEHAAGHGAAGG